MIFTDIYRKLPRARCALQ